MLPVNEYEKLAGVFFCEFDRLRHRDNSKERGVL